MNVTIIGKISVQMMSSQEPDSLYAGFSVVKLGGLVSTAAPPNCPASATRVGFGPHKHGFHLVPSVPGICLQAGVL